jgi:transcriptional repressor NF-X1
MSAAIASTSAEAATPNSTSARGRGYPNRRGRGRGRGTPHTDTGDRPSTSQSNAAPAARSNNRAQGRPPLEREGSARDDPPHAHRGGRGGRRREFGAQLTSDATPESTSSEPSSRPVTPQHKRPQQPPKTKTKLAAVDAPIPTAQDLTTRLTESVSKPPYADCPICFNEIHPLQPTWSCAISEETNQCCWTVFHNKCIVAWSKKSK